MKNSGTPTDSILIIYEKIDKLDSKLDAKIDRLEEHMANANKQLAVYNVELQKHIEGVMLAREENKMLREDFESRITPIQNHVSQVKTAMFVLVRILVGVSALAGFALTLKELL